MISQITEHARSIRETFQREEVQSISRRYFISNGFDGTLTCIGITVGAYLTGIADGSTVIKIGAGAAVGMATSGVWSVWEIERAEKLAELKHVEQQMLTELTETELQARKRTARTINAVMSGLGPTLGMLLPLIPFLFHGIYLTMLESTVLSVLIGITLLSAAGTYMASISDQIWYRAAARMGLAGLVVAIINILLPTGAA